MHREPIDTHRRSSLAPGALVHVQLTLAPPAPTAAGQPRGSAHRRCASSAGRPCCRTAANQPCRSNQRPHIQREGPACAVAPAEAADHSRDSPGRPARLGGAECSREAAVVQPCRVAAAADAAPAAAASGTAALGAGGRCTAPGAVGAAHPAESAQAAVGRVPGTAGSPTAAGATATAAACQK